MSDDDHLPPDAEEAADNGDVGDAKVVRRRKKEVADRRDESGAFWRQVFSTPSGRREMWGLLNAANTFTTKFGCGPNGFPQPEATWFNAGERAYGQRLYHSWLILDRDGVNKMLDEHHPDFKKPDEK